MLPAWCQIADREQNERAFRHARVWKDRHFIGLANFTVICQQIHVDNPSFITHPSRSTKFRFDCVQYVQKRRGGEIGVHGSHTIHEPRLAGRRYWRRMEPTRVPQDGHPAIAEFDQGRFAGGSRRAEARVEQVGAERYEDHAVSNCVDGGL